MKKTIEDYLDANPAVGDTVNKLTELTGIERTNVAIALVALPIVLIISLFNFNVVIDMVGFVYPFLASVYALDTDGKDDDEQWLTYWIVFAGFKMLEGIADSAISFIPFYYMLKVTRLPQPDNPCLQEIPANCL